jgi:hypothetical protein
MLTLNNCFVSEKSSLLGWYLQNSNNRIFILVLNVFKIPRLPWKRWTQSTGASRWRGVAGIAGLRRGRTMARTTSRSCYTAGHAASSPAESTRAASGHVDTSTLHAPAVTENPDEALLTNPKSGTAATARSPAQRSATASSQVRSNLVLSARTRGTSFICHTRYLPRLHC